MRVFSTRCATRDLMVGLPLAAGVKRAGVQNRRQALRVREEIQREK